LVRQHARPGVRAEPAASSASASASSSARTKTTVVRRAQGRLGGGRQQRDARAHRLARNGDGDEVELTTAATARWQTDNHGMIPKDERWIEADGVLLRTFWDKTHGRARHLLPAVLVVNEDVVMVDSTLGAIVTGVA
jgi:hypothetical protein